MSTYLVQSIAAFIVVSALGLVYWLIKRYITESNKSVDTKLTAIEKDLSELKHTVVEKYVRSLEKSIGDNQKSIGVNDARIKNLEREVFKDKDRRLK